MRNRLFFLLLLAFLLASFSASGANVNSAANDDYSGTFCDPCSGPSLSTTTGNTIVLAIRWYYAENACTISGINDPASNVYELGAETTYGGNGLSVYVAKNITGNAANIPSVNFSCSIRYWSITQSQYSRDAAVTVSTTTTGGSADRTTVTSGTFSTTGDTDIISVSQAGVVDIAWTPPTNYDQRAVAARGVMSLSDRSVTADQTNITLTATNNAGAGSGTASMIVIALKNPGAAVGRRKAVIF
jgi:hypothetical protein